MPRKKANRGRNRGRRHKGRGEQHQKQQQQQQQQQQVSQHVPLDLDGMAERASPGHIRQVYLAGLQRSGTSERTKDLAANGLDELQVECVLGKGGFGTVKKVLHRRLGERFALKELHRSESGAYHAQVVEMLALISVQACENVVDVISMDDSRPSAPILMELCEGTLEDAIYMGNPFGCTLPDILRYCAEVASALAYCHDCRIVHCDVKPANVLLAKKPPGSSATGPFVAKVADFGLAESIGAWRCPRSGTPGTVAPEVNRRGGAKACALQDVFSVGAMAGSIFAKGKLLGPNMFTSLMLETEGERAERIALQKMPTRDLKRMHKFQERMTQRTAVDGSARRTYLVPDTMREDMPEKEQYSPLARYARAISHDSQSMLRGQYNSANYVIF